MVLGSMAGRDVVGTKGDGDLGGEVGGEGSCSARAVDEIMLDDDRRKWEALPAQVFSGIGYSLMAPRRTHGTSS